MSFTDDSYQDLPADAEQAFLVLEKFFREDCETSVARSGNDVDPSIFHTDYIARVIGAINELGLEANFSTDVPSIEQVSHSTYLNFSKDVRNYCTRLAIRFGRRAQGFSVRFDSNAKDQIHDYITKIRQVLQALEIETPKKDALLKRLNAFSTEVDLERIRLEAFGEFFISLSTYIGEGVEKLEPVRKWVDSIVGIISGARAHESELPRLPRNEPQKRIEVQKAEPKPETPERSLDDEVPF